MKNLNKAAGTIFVLLALFVATPASAQIALGQYGRLRLRSSVITPPVGHLNIWSDTATKHLMVTDENGITTDVSTGGAASGYATVQDEGIALANRQVINFTGPNVSCVDNGGSSRTDCTIAGASGTVTSIGIGTGLSSTQSPLTTSGTLSIDTSIVVTQTGIQTLTNKTLTAPVLGGSVTGTYTLAGTPTLGANLSIGSGFDITAAGGVSDLNMSASSGVFATPTGASTFGGSTNTFSSGAIGPSAGQQHVIPAVTSSTFTLNGATQTLTNKTLTAPVIAGATASGATAINLSGSTGAFSTSTGASTFGGSSNTFSSGALGPAVGQQHTLPAVASDTFTLNSATQTLTNKTLTAPVIAGATASGGTSINLSGGSGTFITPTGAVTIGPGAVGVSGTTTIDAATTIRRNGISAAETQGLSLYNSTAATGGDPVQMPPYLYLAGSAWNSTGSSSSATQFSISGLPITGTSTAMDFRIQGFTATAGVVEMLKLNISADGASAVAATINSPTYATTGAKILSIKNGGTEKLYVNKDGSVIPGTDLGPTLGESGKGFAEVRSRHFIGDGAAPTIAAGAGAGTGPVVSVAAGSTDTAGSLNIKTGTGPTANATVATVTFNTAFGVVPRCFLTEADSDSQDLYSGALGRIPRIYQTGVTTTTFAITSGTTGLPASTSFVFNYLCVE